MSERWLFWTWVVAVTIALGWALFAGYRTDQRQDRDDERDERQLVIAAARQCVNTWNAREDNRDMAEAGYRRNAATLLGFSSDPVRAQQYRAQVERDVTEIRAFLPNPECDLEAARELLEDQ